MRIAIYPGSFNPWHKGHEDILKKALKCFDKVIIAIGINSEKELPMEVETRAAKLWKKLERYSIIVESFDGLLVDYIDSNKKLDSDKENTCAVIRGLRNGHDLQYEMNQQYWNEDLGLETPIVYFICDRTLSHISSSTIKAVKAIKNGTICKAKGPK